MDQSDRFVGVDYISSLWIPVVAIEAGMDTC